MNKEQLAVAAAVMLAASQGAEIQWKYLHEPGWKDVGGGTLSWSWNVNDYRIKPKTIKYRVAMLGHAVSTWTGTYNVHADAARAETGSAFVRWLTDWIEVEV